MLPTTTTGSPLLTLCDTLPPSSPQHSTSTKNVEASIHSCLVLSKRRSVSATRNLVTLPFCVRLSSGDVTTLPTTVMALTVLLGSAAPGGATGSVPVCRRPSWPDEPRGGRRADLWTTPGAVDRAPAGVHSELRARTQPALSKGAFPWSRDQHRDDAGPPSAAPADGMDSGRGSELPRHRRRGGPG